MLRAHFDYATGEGNSNPTSATKKDSIVDTISAMEFCFIYDKSAILCPGKTEVADLVSFKGTIVQGMDLIDKLEFDSYLTALMVYVAPQLFNTSTDAKPASTRASISCFTVSGVS